MIFQDESGDKDTEPSYSCDAELDDETIEKALSSPLFTQEREDDASRRRADHSHDEGLSSCEPLSSVGQRTVRPVVEQFDFDSQISNVRDNPRHTYSSENEQIRILLERQREQILADCQAEIRKREFQADYDRTSTQKLNEIIESQRGEILRTHQGDEQLRRDQQLLHEQVLSQNRDLVKLMRKVSMKMKELKKFQSFEEKIGRRPIYYF